MRSLLSILAALWALAASPALAALGTPYCAAPVSTSASGAASSVTITLNHAVASTDRLLAFNASTGANLPSQNIASGATITDTQGGSWTSLGNVISGGVRFDVWLSPGGLTYASGDQVTVNWTSTSLSTGKLTAIVGAPGAGAKDKGPSGNATNSPGIAPSVTTSAFTAPGTDAVFSATVVQNAATGEGYCQSGDNSGGAVPCASTDAVFTQACPAVEINGSRGFHVDYKIVSATTALTIRPSLATSRAYVIGYVSLLAAAAAGSAGNGGMLMGRVGR
jgi:hypothetical protein